MRRVRLHLRGERPPRIPTCLPRRFTRSSHSVVFATELPYLKIIIYNLSSPLLLSSFRNLIFFDWIEYILMLDSASVGRARCCRRLLWLSFGVRLSTQRKIILFRRMLVVPRGWVNIILIVLGLKEGEFAQRCLLIQVIIHVQVFLALFEARSVMCVHEVHSCPRTIVWR